MHEDGGMNGGSDLLALSCYQQCATESATDPLVIPELFPELFPVLTLFHPMADDAGGFRRLLE